MKLLFDENLSPKMVAALVDVFPDSAHVDRIGLGGGSDDDVWHYAKDNGFMLVSKDSDFLRKEHAMWTPAKGYLDKAWQQHQSANSIVIEKQDGRYY